MVSRRHPPGLYVLFFTELWERYSFYSMMAILSLYMNEALQFDVAHVGRVYGAYTAGVYFLPLFGGLLADRVLGFNRPVADAAVKVEENSVEARALSPEEARSRVLTLVAVFAISMVFWLAFYQIFYTFTFWARDNTLTTIPPERFQVFEPLGVILLSPVLVAVWRWLQRRNAEPSTLVKMLLGVVLVAIAFGMLAYAGMTGGDTGRVSAQWLIWANVIIALGEISLSPMGLSLVNMLAPPRNRGLLMGGWFASLATGGYLAGYIGGYWDRMPHSRFFLMVTLILIATAVPLSLMTLQIKRTIARSQTVPVGQ